MERTRDSDEVWQGLSSMPRLKTGWLLKLYRTATLNDFRVPPSNRLEALKGTRKGQYSIRINKIVHGQRGISADTALRLARFSVSPLSFGPVFKLTMKSSRPK
jgi:hypothetical protein